MTNYSKWDKFDPDLVCVEIEKQQAVESSKVAKKKVFQAIASESEQSILEAKRNAEALQSQADVAALKAKGGMSARRRNKGKDATDNSSKGDDTTAASSQSLPAAPPKARSLADKLHAITDFLFRLLKQVEQIRACTEKKQSHNEGYIACIRCLQDIHAFSRIKNATVMAALRATSSSTAVSDIAKSEVETVNTTSGPDATVKIIEDLNESEAFLIEQTINCLSLFSLSRGEYALSVECARYVLKRQGDHADAGIWIMRGLALAAMGAPYLTMLHFASASTVNSDYAGLKECSPIVDKAVITHARLTVQCSREELVAREVTHSVLSYFTSKAHLLQAVPDLAVITPAEVNNMLNEGSVHGVDVTKALSNYGTTGSANAWKVDVSNIVSLHMDEEVPEKGPTAMLTIINDTNTHTSTSYDMTCTSIASMLQQYVTSHTSSAKSCVSPYGTLLHATRSIIQSRSSESEYMHRVLMVLAGLNIVRKLFYEAQLLCLESIYQTAEVKYSTTIMLINGLESTVSALDTPVHATEDASLIHLLLQGVPIGNLTFNNNARTDLMKWSDVRLYLQRLQSACYINIATCMCQHSVKLRMLGTTPNNSTTTATSATGIDNSISTAIRITSVTDLVGPSSTLTTPLCYINQGLSIADSLSGRFRKLFVLEKMHRFTEGLAECRTIQHLLQNKDYSTLTGSFVAHDFNGSGLGQEYIPGFVLPMPVASVLAPNKNNATTEVIVVDDGREVEKGESDVQLEAEFESITSAGVIGAVDKSVSPLFRLSCSHTPSDEGVALPVWRAQLQKKMDMFEFLIRKHGVK